MLQMGQLKNTIFFKAINNSKIKQAMKRSHGKLTSPYTNSRFNSHSKTVYTVAT